ncbi:hypothetical protein QBC37DRAFT_432233 [Rhypophila decipiens]|uniref:Heterokaryon incompatibility domain-containing protein n=1 Tax=Rhypophila decipiens TaxID=261697 RepID=A0AAN7B2V6_9PEZI|nr:hypothetical protein QBC37DRAFT_432233 [Rhypophila decipiens]
MVEVNNRLCHACGAIFSGSTRPHRSTEQPGFPAKHIHHLSLQSFRTAVDAGCFICSVFQESRGAESANISSEAQGPFSTYMLTERDQIRGTCMLNVQINHLHAASSNIKPSYYVFEIVKVDEDISLNTPSTQRLDLLSRWVYDCWQCNNATHAACQHYRETAKRLALRKPSKLLELGTGDSQGSVRLTLLGPEATPFPAYATLGRGGKAPDGTSSLLTAIGNSWLPVNQLPKTIQDALTVTHHVGARFLWTPDLWDDNITTGDNDHIHRADIIAGGLFNIAICRAAHDLAEEEGILPALGQNPSVPVVAPNWAPSSKSAVLDPDTMRKALAPATSDAQAYHDNFVAPATLYCTKQQLWWQCLAGSYSETFPSGVGNGSSLPWIHGIHHLDPCVFRNLDDSLPPVAVPNGAAATWPFAERLTSLWTQVVSIFSAANQAEQSDRILLMDSMASHFRDLASPYQPGFETAVYHAGLWFAAGDSGVHQLLWHAPKKALTEGRRVSGVPTWSWAATTASAQYSFYLPALGFPVTPAIWPGTILDDAVAEVVPPPRPAEATLRLRGRLIPIEIVDYDRRGSGSFRAVFLDAGRATAGMIFDVDENKELARKHRGRPTGGYFALPLTLKTLDSPGPSSRQFAMQGLVLCPRPAGDGDNGGDGVYTRSGWFRCDSSGVYEWKDVDVLEICGLGAENDRQTIVLV